MCLGIVLLQGWEGILCRHLVCLVSYFKFPILIESLLVASSCDVERGFSRGGLTVSKLRHTLSDEATRAATVLHSWHEIPGLIPESEIIQIFKDKSRRPKQPSSSQVEEEDEDAIMVVD